MKGTMVVFFCLGIWGRLSAQHEGAALLLSPAVLEEATIRIVPNPMVGGSYFWVRVPDGEVLKGVEVVDSTGERINRTDITFSKMGLFLPRIKPGVYFLRLYLTEESLFKKVLIQ